jgi:glycerate dehydrogenase
MKLVFMETDTLGEDVDLSYFDELGEVIRYSRSTPEQYAKRIEEAQILIVNKIPVNETTLKKAKELELVCVTATGTNIVDFAYTNSHNIKVCNVKGYSTNSVIQHTFALLFYVYEKLSYYDCYVKSGGYMHSDIFSHFTKVYHELAGKTWGIIGLGEIGRGVARIAKEFGCNIIYYSTSGRNINSAYMQVSLDTLLKTSDIISIHAPLNDKTMKLIGEKELRSMKKNGVLLNLGRGPIIDEQALATALKEQWIGAAGLDVLAVEPMSENNPLKEIQDSARLIITPHIAWAAIEARERVAREVYKNIEAYLNNTERNIVTG